jgi:hypothetical protein
MLTAIIRLKFVCVYDRSVPVLSQNLLSGAPVERHGSTNACYRMQSLSQDDSSTPKFIKSNRALFTVDGFGNAHLDPFQTYPSELSPQCISKVLTYCVSPFF